MKKIVFVVILIVADQLLKMIAVKNLLPAWGGVFRSVCNPLLSWGIPLEGLWFWLAWIFAFGALVFLIRKFNFNIFLLLAFAGAFSNFIDRIARGCVVDYIKISSFPIFNLADILITGGIFLFVFYFVFKK